MGEGTDEDVDRLSRLWRHALQPYVSGERLGPDSRSVGDELVRDLVELVFREMGHARITAPPFGGRPASERVEELRRRREGCARPRENRALNHEDDHSECDAAPGSSDPS